MLQSLSFFIWTQGEDTDLIVLCSELETQRVPAGGE